MKQLLTLTFLFLSFHLFSQDLDCKQFKTGEFYIPVDDVTQTEHTLNRNEKYQIESDSSGDTIYTNIEWIDDCKYVLTFNEELTTRPISDSEKFINKNGGVVVTIIEIIKNGYVFEAFLDLEDEPYLSKGTVFVKK